MLRFVLAIAAVAFISTSGFAKENHSHEAAGVAPEQALKWLQNGNSRFVNGNFRKDGRSKEDVKRLSTGQKPHTILISCSDSRVPPEHVFDQGLGEIFTIRVAGEQLNDNVIASTEYAVEHLGVKLIVVMGHTQCGAVKAAIGTKTGESAGSPALDALVADLKPRISVTGKTSADFGVEASANAKGVAAELLKKSKILADRVQKGDIKIVSSLYHIETGKAEWL